MMQQIIIGLIFIAAVIYLVRLVYRNFRSGSACETGCGKCGAVDFAKLEKQLKEKGL
ncbi:FeoB-associated Cys-rich membrane protein [Fulvivirgaceae bacterium PWU4]|uniref:FeoB-associated Cys-rich membrane protein n=1 Tax=Chryseosolibacter histidini TaxID=2782349 RepID=A0AAP2GPB7_9BACT|nr:FeoB-associated Cys-rich membrane protein [Chryseosolibacter histidini]MBT1698933.1 FeoB-associated Cys-rich membrane protein [Chryseosolibacter histidini]